MNKITTVAISLVMSASLAAPNRLNFGFGVDVGVAASDENAVFDGSVLGYMKQDQNWSLGSYDFVISNTVTALVGSEGGAVEFGAAFGNENRLRFSHRIDYLASSTDDFFFDNKISVAVGVERQICGYDGVWAEAKLSATVLSHANATVHPKMSVSIKKDLFMDQGE